MRIAWTAALLATTAALAAAPAALAQEPPAEKSANVTWLGTLAEPEVISAHFRTRGGREEMYVSTLRGLATYDVTDPAAPVKLGFLPLPHFENEDVDLAASRDLLLISNDPSEGAGVLYVISIADPAAPEIVGQMATGNVASGSGFEFLFDAIPGVVPLPESAKTGTGHTASCVDAGGVECRYVYLAGTAAGIDVVDLADPAAPAYATPRNFPAEEATAALASHDVQFDRHGLAWIAGYGGTAAYDVSDPLAPRLVYRTDEQGRSGYAEDPANDGKSLNDFIHHNSLRIPNRSLASSPAGADPDADSDVVLITEEDYNRPGCAGAGSFESWRISADEDAGGTPLLHPLGRFDVEEDPSAPALCSAHYFDERAGLVAQGWYEQGTRFLSIADPAKIEQVGYWIPAGNVTWGALFPPSDPTGEIVYALDNTRGIDVLRVDRPGPEGGSPGTGGSGGSGGASGGSGPGGGASAAPGALDLALTIRDGRGRVRPGARLRYRLRVRNRSALPARDVTVRVRFSRAARRIDGRRRVSFRVRSLAPGARRDLRLVLRARRPAAARRLTVVARLSAPGDADRRNDRAVDRNRVGRPRASGALARAVLRMPEVSAPRTLLAGSRTAGAVVYGLCRLLPPL
jgi:hypothetical protein